MAVLLLVSISSVAAQEEQGSEQGQVFCPAKGRFSARLLEMTESDSVTFSWSANASVEFTIVAVSGLVVLVNLSGAAGNGTFVVPANGLHSFQFHNPNDVSVTVQWTIRVVPSSNPQLVLLVSTSLAIVLLVVMALAVLITRKRASHRSAGSVRCHWCGALNGNSRSNCFKCGEDLQRNPRT
jgi:heme A synthase